MLKFYLGLKSISEKNNFVYLNCKMRIFLICSGGIDLSRFVI